MDENLAKRLKSKSVENSIINSISQDFNLTPILAEAYFKQIKNYFLKHADIRLSEGQVHYLAIDDREPSSKPIDLCRKVSVHLSLHNPSEDLDVYKKEGLSGLRRHRIRRMCKEAFEQGAVLATEDLAFLLTCGVITIKRDMAQMRRAGLTIVSRGWRHDMGRGTSHKTDILELYFQGYQFSQIEQKTQHSETAVKRYIQDFSKIILLYQKGFETKEIRIATGFSNRLIGEYIKLYQKNKKKNNPRLKIIASKKNQTKAR